VCAYDIRERKKGAITAELTMPNKTPKKLLSALLLLPPPPSNLLYSTLKAAYNNALSSVLSSISEVASKSLSTAVLEIVVPCPHHFLPWEFHRPKTLVYDQTQRLLSSLYSLVSVICARDSIDVEGEGGVDTRILLIAYSGDHTYFGNKESPSKPLQGPIIDLPTLALSRRAWQHVFSVCSEEGEILLNKFLCLADCPHSSSVTRPLWDIRKVDPGIGITLPTEGSQDVQLLECGREAHYSIAVGGTFDHLHAGHKLLLTMATLLLQPPGQSDQRRRIIVGITQDELLKNKKYADFLESWDTRQQNVSNFLLALLDYSAPGTARPTTYEASRPGPNGKAVHVMLDPALEIECVAISDPYGPTITDESISALIVSGETRGGGQAVNRVREELGWPLLEVFEIDVLEAGEPGDCGWTNESFDSKISSTELRRRQSEKAKQLHRNALG
jgi:phosphopantetheine adenylyltransferase